MSSANTEIPGLPQKPKRADALRNYEKLLAAAREAFAEHGTDASLEDIARRAGVGIGTLYRNFPTRQHLLEAVYVGEFEEICRAAKDLEHLDPWDALVTWFRQFVGYSTVKRAVGAELLDYVEADADVFRATRAGLTEAGDALLGRAQAAGVVRPDAKFIEVARMVGGIAQIRGSDPDEVGRILDLALDGLRYRP
jgi:AcrR family transcriptional regulator